MSLRTRGSAALMLVAVLAAPPVLAAPIAPSTPTAESEVPGTPRADPALATDGRGADNSVELLLRLQQAPTAATEGPQGRERPQPAAGALPAAPTTLLQELKEWKTSLFGDGSAEFANSTAERRIDAPQTSREGSHGMGALPDAPRGHAAGTLPVRASAGGVLAHPVVRFIRENRALSIGASIGLLAAVWLTANYRGRSRRRR